MSDLVDKPIGRILISNDDGIDATGIKILREIASHLCDDVWVIAPVKTGLAHRVQLPFVMTY